MASTRELRRRIKSVRSTRQITKAMELVSSAKMRKSSEATFASRPYASRLNHLLQDILRTPEDLQGHAFNHPLLQAKFLKPKDEKKVLAIAIASDRGMAGVYNSAVLKQSLKLVKDKTEAGFAVDFITVGKKIESGLLLAGQNIVQSYPNFSSHPTLHDTHPLTAAATHGFIQEGYVEVVLIFTEFFSMLRQEAMLYPLIPLVPTFEEEREVEFIFEPSPEKILDELIPRLIEVKLYQCILESLASEHSARRLAMKNATDNASDMIEDLTLTFNGLRQSAITQEIAEITSGAAALST